ncbi:CoA transferase [Shinella sp.]|uniref:CaiB/BaiF CoA-transferase family protein n=1 Tax=Shinella sp. TaxID=1870904 RepID=UPI003F6F13A5
MSNADLSRPLAGIRVVERASGPAAAYAGRLMATLGAEVTAVEPAGGSSLRRAEPFLSGTKVSALFAYLSAGKKFSGADPQTDRVAFEALLDSADILIEDVPLRDKAALGLAPDAVEERFSNLVHVSVLPFGATGPKADWKGEEINLIHASGEGNLLPNGLSLDMFPERPPLKIHGNFMQFQGGVGAMLGGLAALWARPTAGGQFVDISVQECGVVVGLFAIQQLGDGFKERRQSRSFRYGGVMPCKDGFVELLTIEDKQWRSFVTLMGDPEWAKEEGLQDPLARGRRGEEINRHLRAWTATQTCDDLVTRGQAFGVPLAKYATPAEVLDGAQENARKIFASVAIEGVGERRVFVAPYRFGPEPLALGGSPASAPVPAQPKAPVSSAPASGRPLAGVRILDFTIHAAGPFGTHMLGQLGAECIKVETSKRLDMFRRPHPVYGRMEPSTFAHVVADKKSIRINVKKSEGVALVKRIAAKSDIVAESFRAGVMDRLGISFAELAKVKQDIIMLSSCACGQTGPDAHFAGYAPLFAAWGGLGTLSGYEDGPPLEIRHVMDHSVGLNAASVALAALNFRRRTGQGAHVDLAAREIASALIGEALLQTDHGDEPQRMGNHHLGMAPHGAYPAKGEDCWVSIAVANDDEWRVLAGLIGGAAADPCLATVAGRLASRDRLDGLVGAWTRNHDAEEIAVLLQQNGIAAHASWTPEMVVADPHMRERAAIRDIVVGGVVRPAVSVPVRLSKTSGRGIENGAPAALGGDEDYVYGELLGMSRAERSALEEAEVII